RRKTFHKLAIAQTVVMFDVAHGTEASHKLGVYFRNLLDERRRNPGDDLVSMLALAEVDGERLPEEILISFLRQLVNAGGDTTYRATSVLLTGLRRRSSSRALKYTPSLREASVPCATS